MVSRSPSPYPSPVVRVVQNTADLTSWGSDHPTPNTEARSRGTEPTALNTTHRGLSTFRGGLGFLLDLPLDHLDLVIGVAALAQHLTAGDHVRDVVIPQLRRVGDPS